MVTPPVHYAHCAQCGFLHRISNNPRFFFVANLLGFDTVPVRTVTGTPVLALPGAGKLVSFTTRDCSVRALTGAFRSSQRDLHPLTSSSSKFGRHHGVHPSSWSSSAFAFHTGIGYRSHPPGSDSAPSHVVIGPPFTTVDGNPVHHYIYIYRLVKLLVLRCYPLPLVCTRFFPAS